ncbi:uncharacterized protein LOC105208996 isoform X1 [Zeugodacus cucurbitae]|uniref:Nostrin n=1 Tax=Zeugodacus cucurbitae TaxID=28588 RepID=A0A0A1XJ71_ZEUCU|nr:uncharacterized protein LOC105208996 isoform X1 [Zeugodacus cucurbitae]XP_011177428.1 uncharacterized protein LOC105208996 isoform X1 [Zeugodacus cucurbitae]XP_054087550.1 uncharacterized protein LOC105208996 isoform X1 [Zeugodacus cucurbitae]XP_054087551.1 uncharacterized protein LOC105208996 isoform X1 [Zeugodacus cucurbitae]
MNRLRTQKFKVNAENTSNNNNNINNENNNGGGSNNNNVSGLLPTSSLLNKLTKRYSTLSHRITRRHHAGRKGSSPQKVASGSYDMTGAHSDDHRLEIGAPVLISTTTLDADRFDVSEERLRQIGGGIAATSTMVRTINVHSSPQMPSSGSETEVYADALSTPPVVDEPAEPAGVEEEEQYELASAGTPKIAAEPAVSEADLNARLLLKLPIFPVPEMDTQNVSSTTTSAESPASSVEQRTVAAAAIEKVLSPCKPRVPTPPPKLRRRQHSKSAQNLHRAEMKIFLEKTPSMTLDMSLTTADLDNCRDLPRLPELFGVSKCSLAPSDYEENDADKENSSPSVELSPPQCKSDPNTPMCAEQKVCGYLSQQLHFKSVDSLDMRNTNGKRRSVVFSSNTSINQHGSKNSLTSHASTIEEFDLKSVSCQSLNAQSLFVSIDELNEITRQINESEEFNEDIDLEYCQHRDNLKPSERRITLLKNKNSRLINFNNNKEKFKKGWHGVKHWIGEESTKLKEVVQKQANLQRVATSKLSLNNSECRQSPSVHGSVMLRGGESRVGLPVLRDSDTSVVSINLQQSQGATSAFVSTDDLVDGSGVGDVSGNTENEEDLESSFTQRPADETPTVAKLLEGQNGFEELRRYVKQGGDFGKELVMILQERVESETLYSKSLSKMANKLNKACRELPGSIADAWRGVATEMENRSDIHRQLSASLTDEIVKPLKNIIDAHHKTRKSVESNVDKAARTLAEWRVSESKAKKSSHTAARENEKLQDALLDVRIQKSPSIALLHQGPNKLAAEKEIRSAEKDCAKLDSKRKKAEEAVKRADVEYYTLCIRAERARVDWEMAVLRGSSLLQNIENQRLVNMKNFIANYSRLTSNMNPILDGLMQRLQPQVDACNVLKDMQVVKNIRRNSEGPSEQLLPDFYCEHTTLAMNRERRKHALIKLLQLVKADLERERRSRNGLKGLSQSLNNQENQNITDKLYHIRSMLTYLEGARFKLHSALLELDHKPRSSHPLAQHIQVTRDRTGLQQSVLKVPLWLKNNDRMSQDDSASVQENEYECVNQTNSNISNASCTDLSKNNLIHKFSRSKSNIETLSNKTQLCIASIDKTKTIPAHSDNDPYSDRGQADGGSNQQDSDFDEFSSQDDDDEQTTTTSSTGRKEHKAIIEKSTMLANGTATVMSNGAATPTIYQNAAELHNGQSNGGAPVILSRCKALYCYTPKLYDELELTPGDIIEVHAKQEDGWWLGALGNHVGIFPATYVEEFA